MHSPPPTPSTRSNGRATRTKDALQAEADIAAQSIISRKRNFDQAGLITPRETPRKKDLNKDGQLKGSLAAKVLFPTARRKKFQVFQDPSSPDPFHDDAKNPFKAPAPTKKRQRRSTTPEPVVADDAGPRTPDRDTEAALDHPDRARSSGRRTRSMKRTPSPHRTDGMTYVFRGKKVFRKYHSAEEAEAAEAIKPKRLFVKEMNAPKLSNPFDEEDDSLKADSEEDGFDGLELSTYQEKPPVSRVAALPRSTARKLF